MGAGPPGGPIYGSVISTPNRGGYQMLSQPPLPAAPVSQPVIQQAYQDPYPQQVMAPHSYQDPFPQQ
jgi:hypothetical protein